MRFDKWYALRATAWALCWVYMNPELRNLEIWGSPEKVGWLIGMYLVTGIILETTYRWIAWGRIFPNASQPAVIRPECPEHPWICLMNKSPEVGSEIEVFCADGQTRNGCFIRRDDGLTGIAVRFTTEDERKLAKNAYLLRPTHWRALKETVEKKKEKR